MLLFFSCVLLFLVVFLLVCSFHCLLWNSMLGLVGGLRVWVSPFECGFLSQRLVENYFSYTYFVLLVFFVIFDLEISLLLNIPFQGVLFKNFLYYAFFMVLVSLGFFFEVKKGYVIWSY